MSFLVLPITWKNLSYILTHFLVISITWINWIELNWISPVWILDYINHMNEFLLYELFILMYFKYMNDFLLYEFLDFNTYMKMNKSLYIIIFSNYTNFVLLAILSIPTLVLFLDINYMNLNGLNRILLLLCDFLVIPII